MQLRGLKNTSSGKVFLAGAGPGDVGLITLKLCNALKMAEVIITDRLVNPAIIETYARPDAKVLFAGKQGFADASTSMEDINKLVTEYALLGKVVLRLKGGDVAFFSNVLAELENLVRHGIDFEIIPGITAASGASAYAGIPLTAQGYSQGVQFISYNPKSIFSNERWQQLAVSNDTLVFYMAASILPEIVSHFLSRGRNPSYPFAIVEQATTPSQRVFITTLAEYKTEFGEMIFNTPSIIILGEVVRLHSSFNWFNGSASVSVFKQLS